MKQSLFGLNLLALLTVFGGQLLTATSVLAQSEQQSEPETSETAIAPETPEPVADEPVEAVAAAPEPASEFTRSHLLSETPVFPQGRLSEVEATSATTVTDWVAQIEAALVQITDVRIEATETGVKVVLETVNGELAAPATAVSGNALILEIPNAVLMRGEFEQFDPADGLALVQVTALPGDMVQVAITGTEAVPDVDIATAATGLTLTVIPGIAQAGEDDDAIRIGVIGEEGSRYFEPNTSTATRTDTPLRDIPQSIQVIPREVLEDQQINTLEGALRNVSGVVSAEQTFNGQAFIIRGFRGPAILQDGLRRNDGRLFGFAELSNVESIEVLKGPASILAGSLEPGGVINLATEQPLSEPFYNLEFQAGNRGSISPSIDISGPLTDDGRLLYRLNALYRHEDSFRGFNTDLERFFIAPTIRWQISDLTDLTVRLEYTND